MVESVATLAFAAVVVVVRCLDGGNNVAADVTKPSIVDIVPHDALNAVASFRLDHLPGRT